MRVSFALNAEQRMILRILRLAGKLHFPALQRVVKALDAVNSDFDEFIRSVADNELPLLLLPEKPKVSALERTVEGLVFVGLVKTTTHTRNDAWFSPTADRGIRDTDIELTTEGDRVAKSITDARQLVLRSPSVRRTTIFVACAFGHDDVDLLYEQHIAPMCNAAGYRPIRVDMTEPHRTITDAIIQGITDCACVIADLTYARPSVYFEVGFSLGLGVPVLLTCRSDHHRGTQEDQRVHFDLAQHKISFWTPKADGGVRWPKGMDPASRLVVAAHAS